MDASRLLVLAVLAAASLVLAGCLGDDDRNIYRPGGAYARTLDASGDRVVVEAAGGDPVAKLRVRDRSYKVYGPDFVPLGQVVWSDTDAVGIRPLGEAEPTWLRPVDDAVYELAGRLRVERTSQGWAVFGVDGELIGSFERDADKWRLREDYGEGPVLHAEPAGGRTVVGAGDEAVLTAPAGELADVEVLALALPELGLLERALVGAWLHRGAGGAQPQPTD